MTDWLYFLPLSFYQIIHSITHVHFTSNCTFRMHELNTKLAYMSRNNDIVEWTWNVILCIFKPHRFDVISENYSFTAVINKSFWTKQFLIKNWVSLGLERRIRCRMSKFHHWFELMKKFRSRHLKIRTAKFFQNEAKMGAKLWNQFDDKSFRTELKTRPLFKSPKYSN